MNVEISIGLVCCADPYRNTYAIQDWNNLQGERPLPAIALGSIPRFATGVQKKITYSVGDTVVYIKPEDPLKWCTFTTLIILGKLSTNPIPALDFQRTPDKDPANNLAYTNFKGFDSLDTTFGVAPNDWSAWGHGSIDLLPGEYEEAGALVSFSVKDYLAGFYGTATKLYVSGMDRRIVERSMLRSESTISSDSDIAIVGRSTITTNKSVGNIDQAFYGQLEETEQGIKPKEDPEPTVYRFVEQYGDALYGKQQTLLSEDGSTPLFRERTANDGTKTILSASGLQIGRLGGIVSTMYVGKRHNKNEYEYAEVEDGLVDPLSYLEGDDWERRYDKELIEGNIFPTSFVESGNAEYEELPYVELSDTQQPEGSVSVTKGKNLIDFRKDGSVAIYDAWGSYILLSHGNIEFHAMNDLIGISSRDTLNFAGGHRTDFAMQNISQQSSDGDIRVLAGKCWQVQSTERSVVESNGTVQLMGKKEARIDALDIYITCRNTESKELSGKGSLRILVPDGQLLMTGKYTSVNGESVGITGSKSAISLTNSETPLVIAGNLTVNGGIICQQSTLSVARLGFDGKVNTNPIGPGNRANIENTIGSIRAKTELTAGGGIYTVGPVVGGQVCQWSAGEKEYVKKYAGGGDANKKVSDFTTANMPQAQTLVEYIPTDVIETGFTLNTDDANTCIRVTHKLPVDNATSVGRPEYKGAKSTQYIYPGRTFWISNGVLDETTNEWYGFSKLPVTKTNGDN